MKKPDYLLGADPEFSGLLNGKIISANGVVENNDLGADGNGYTFEVRPSPAESPFVLVDNIRKIFQFNHKRNKKLQKIDWRAGSWVGGYPLGGHIHFGFSPEYVREQVASNMDDWTSFLDQYLGTTSLLLEDKIEGVKRREGKSYGIKGDKRPQPHGFEYRVCSSWLVSPIVATTILSLAKVCMDELLTNPNIKIPLFANKDDFWKMNTDKIRGKFNYIWSDITNMASYPDYKKYIDIIYFIISNKRSWTPKMDMKTSWGIIGDIPKVKTTRVTLDNIWRNFSVEMA